MESHIDPAAPFPKYRVRVARNLPARGDGAFVVYWMVAARRAVWNFALQRAADWATELKRPLVILEVLACGGRWDSDRFHHFTFDGMADNARQLAERPVLYYPYVEGRPGDAQELFRALAKEACLIVTDDFPIDLPAIRTVDDEAQVRIEKIDGNGLLPVREAGKAFPTAQAFRRFLHATIRDYLFDFPQRQPLTRRDLPRMEALPAKIVRRWPAAEPASLAGEVDLARLPIDHTVKSVALKGGASAAGKAWQSFLLGKLARYADDRNQPEADAASGLSPYLHFGHIGIHQIFHDLIEKESWSPQRLPEKPSGRRNGWWNMSGPAEEFLDEILTWREIGLNACAELPGFDRYESLPDWAHATLARHAGDRRPHIYSRPELAAAATHDPLWNAAQRQLLREGRIQNYLRMVWGKKILQWSASPQESLETLIDLNNRYALDGQDPNSYSGIFWVLGRYDRPWAPERPIFGRIRYMSSENTARKLRVKGYLQRYGSNGVH
jgi:deoxyribodipyrimidine photo-lyase